MASRRTCLLGVLLVSACSVGELDLDGKSCPCVDGYRCEPSTNTCVATSADGGGTLDASADTLAGGDTGTGLDAAADPDSTAPEGGVEDAASDTAAEDSGPLDTGPVDTGPMTTTVPVVVDTYVDSSMPTVSFAASPVFLVDADPIAYETFLLPADPELPPGAEVVSATLVLHCFDVGALVEVHAVTASWDETIAWDTRPTTDPTPTATFVPALGDAMIDVTALVQSWVDGTPNHGVALVTAGTNGSDYDSNEAASAALRPRLVISYR